MAAIFGVIFGVSSVGLSISLGAALNKKIKEIDAYNVKHEQCKQRAVDTENMVYRIMNPTNETVNPIPDNSRKEFVFTKCMGIELK